MKEIIKKTILHPYAKSWDKYIQDKKKEDILEILKRFKLDKEKERRVIGFRITLSILKNSKELYKPSDVTNKVLETLSDCDYLNLDIIKAFQSRLNLETEVNLKDYHEIFNNKIIECNIGKKINKYTKWFVDLLTYYYFSQGCTSNKEIRKEVEKSLVNKINIVNIKELSIDEFQRRNGFLRKDVIDIISEIVIRYKDDIADLCKHIVNESQNDLDILTGEIVQQEIMQEVVPTGDVAKDILNVFSSATNNKKEIVEVLPVKDKKPSVENIKNKSITEKKEDIKKNEEYVSDETIMYLKALANSLGYNLVKKHELSKENQGLERDVKLLKSMADVENQFILSELYNSYKNIAKISKENLAANLESFFVNLALNGFEANEDGYRLGEIVKVNTKDALKKYKFNNPVSEDGEVQGVVKYLAWNYKGMQVVPMIIEHK